MPNILRRSWPDKKTLIKFIEKEYVLPKIYKMHTPVSKDAAYADVDMLLEQAIDDPQVFLTRGKVAGIFTLGKPKARKGSERQCGVPVALF